MKYSIIIPVYNRPQEVKELLETLAVQEFKDFELVMVEDGSVEKSDHIVEQYQDQINIRYFFKPNSGPGDSRNYGMAKAEGDYLVFFDSDCLIPPDYFTKVNAFLAETPLDTYGGPDAAHESFSDMQKAIDYCMTSTITTGGIRGKKKHLDNYQPRSFNMGVKKEVYERVGGYGNIHPGEDPDWSFRIMEAGFKVGLIPDAHVYHKRRIDLKKFSKQVYKFGLVRNILGKWHKGTTKAVYFLPTMFLFFCLFSLLGAILVSPLVLLPLGFFVVVLWLDALRSTKSLKIASLAVIATFVQFFSYGYGFLKSFVAITLLGKEEKETFKNVFFR